MVLIPVMQLLLLPLSRHLPDLCLIRNKHSLPLAINLIHHQRFKWSVLLLLLDLCWLFQCLCSFCVLCPMLAVSLGCTYPSDEHWFIPGFSLGPCCSYYQFYVGCFQSLFSFCVLCSMLAVSLDCPFVNALSGNLIIFACIKRD